LRGKACLITGGAKRLGRASALALAQAGADVAITFRNSAREAQQTVVDLSSFGVRAFALHCDITDEASVKSMMKEAGRELGRIDILVNNAANYDTAEFERLTLRQWDSIFASNTRGPFLVSREALKWMRRKAHWIGVRRSTKQDRSQNHSHGLARRPASLGRNAHYCSSKAALHMLTKVMAKALAPEIAVNAVAPGMIDLGETAAPRFCAAWPSKLPCSATDAEMKLPPPSCSSRPPRNSSPGQILAVDGGLG
jgi:NAD(P)-dependent dehydrogenase (short-subunit alcohol dehydrogenase family)